MSKENPMVQNVIRKTREERGWSQQELAEHAGLSRTGISAIEAGRLIPSTAAALALAAVFGCRVEDLFVLVEKEAVEWAWPPSQDPCRYWRALVGSKQLLFPVAASPLGTVPHDGVWREGKCHDQPFADPARTLVLACCDPAVGLLAAEYARQTPFRMLVLPRASRVGLNLLAAGIVHAAGLHLGGAESGAGNRAAAAELLRGGFHLLRVTDWEEGLALSPGLKAGGMSGILTSDLRWVGREPGSGARQIFDEISAGRISPAGLARDHRGVVQVIHSGLAQVGVSLRLVCEEEGLDFLSIRKEGYDLCILDAVMEDPRVRALIEVVRSSVYSRMLADLPGYENRNTGNLDSSRQQI